MTMFPEGPKVEVNDLISEIMRAIDKAEEEEMPQLVEKLKELKKAAAEKFHWESGEVDVERIARGWQQKPGEPDRILNKEILPEFEGVEEMVDTHLRLVRLQLQRTRNYFSSRPHGTGAQKSLEDISEELREDES